MRILFEKLKIAHICFSVRAENTRDSALFPPGPNHPDASNGSLGREAFPFFQAGF